jgi:formylmethanofuran dehydrogenase subunit E
MTMKAALRALLALAMLVPAAANAETKEEWIALGARIHGAFGPFIPVGIRIGLDAVERLKPGPRDIMVTFHNGTKPPCPCVADGVMLATRTSPGQGSLQISPERAPDGLMAVVVIANKKTGEAFRYSISDESLPMILSWLKADPPARYDAAMHAVGLFVVEPVK